MERVYSVFSYCNVYILIKIIKKMRMRWKGHAAFMEEEECV
jgi:hypothetical protein